MKALEMLYVQDVADLLGLSIWGVYRLVSAGRLPRVKVGSRLRFRREWVEALLTPPAA